mgnify:CR=1 FL=1
MVILMKNMSEENLFSKLEKILTKEKEYVFDFSGANFSDKFLYDLIYDISKNTTVKFWYRGLSNSQFRIVRRALKDARYHKESRD